ncbi:MAG: hypothetical protein HFI71_00175 [Lachnospiraceae bacterium]|nr:hypothetical protein [Lachnospiraceae bacterium]
MMKKLISKAIYLHNLPPVTNTLMTGGRLRSIINHQNLVFGIHRTNIRYLQF